jgi:hypothetical protein
MLLGGAQSDRAAGTASVTPAGTQSFTIYTPPNGTAGQHTAEEPSIGTNWNSGAVMYQAGVTTLRVTFDDTQAGSPATWTNVSSPLTNQTTLDPILFTDPVTGRTIVSQLDLACSLSEFSDNDGASWTPDQGCGLNGIEDHQSIGGGPFHAPIPGPPAPAYPHAVYYCNQDFVNSTYAACALSLDGGITYGSGVPIYNLTQCGGLHGHIRVAPDGTAIVPNQNCAPTDSPTGSSPFPNQAAVVSTTNGASWAVNVIPGSHETLRSDPSVAADKAGKWYFGYEDSVDSSSGEQIGGHALISMSSDDGTSWSAPVDVGAPFGVQNVTFPEVIAGDSGRAAYAFLGSTTAGDPENTAFQGLWDLYVSFTYDGGATWTTSDLTPNDPVERACIYLAGDGTCPSSKRNLLDFMDITVDNHGRVLVGYADGCTGTCVSDLSQPCPDTICASGPTASRDRLSSIARLTCGEGLFAPFDLALACAPVTSTPEIPWVPSALLMAAGAAAIGWRRRSGPRDPVAG